MAMAKEKRITRNKQASARWEAEADTDSSSILLGEAAFDRNDTDKAGRCRRERAHV